MSTKIPRRIIQTARSRELPLLQRAAAANLRLLNPGFEYLFFDDPGVEAFISEHYPEYKEVFNSFPFRIQRYDFFRYLAVFYFGGFYFDTDVFFCEGLSNLLELRGVFPFEDLNMNRFLRSEHGMDWHLGNYGFGAGAGHPFLRAVIENCILAQRNPQWVLPMMRGTTRALRNEYQVLNTTGPGLVSRTFAENRQDAKTMSVLFPPDVNDPRDWHKFGDIGVHVMDGSWRMKRSFGVARLLLFWEAFKMRRFARESQALGKTRSPNCAETTSVA